MTQRLIAAVRTCAAGLVLLPLLIGAALAEAPTAAPAGGWRTEILRDHPLTGRLYDLTAERFADHVTVLDDLAGARFVLLGEKHDNPDHHALQAEIVRRLGREDGFAAVVFEMLSPEQADALPARGAAGVDLDALAQAIEWETRGWPDWPAYRAIFAEALAARMALRPGNPRREAVLATVREGLAAAMDEAERARFALDRPLDPADAARLLDQIEAAHCGYAPRDRLAPMVDAQRLKDAALADALIAASAEDGPAVLIAGGGHVRRDWAAPLYLARRGAAESRILLFVEVAPESEDPAAYAPRDSTGSPAADYLWFTPRVDLDDPCARFAQQLERMKTSGDPPAPE
ncbi:MAG: ChaN family lipoprotein [Alphaproteobacteria bacterium]|nr:ChaN family lipoprotein [Alphaproteobacteria bacterium]